MKSRSPLRSSTKPVVKAPAFKTSSLVWAGALALCASDGFGGSPITVTTLAPAVLDQPADAAVVEDCRAWRLTPADAARLLSLCVPITAEERHAAFYWLPCSISGTGILDGEPVRFEINAAATVPISRSDGGSTLPSPQTPDLQRLRKRRAAK